MQMKDIAELVGEEVAVEFPGYEAHLGYGAGAAIVRAVVVAAPVQWDVGSGRQPVVQKGARVKITARFRSGLPSGFHEFAPGYETNVPSRQVLRAWGGDDALRSGGSTHGMSDAAREAERERRYVEQDAIREALTRLGLVECERGMGGEEGFMLKGGSVIFARGELAVWLKRVDPVRVAGEAIDEMKKAADPEEWESLKLDVLAEVEQGLAVSDADIEPAPEDKYAQDFDEATDRAMRSGGAGPA